MSYTSEELIDHIRELEQILAEASDELGQAIKWLEEEGVTSIETEDNYLDNLADQLENITESMPIYASYEKCKWSHAIHDIMTKLYDAVRKRRAAISRGDIQ